MVVKDIPISEFSVLVSAITTCRNKLNQLAYYFAMQQKHCLWVQNLRDFLEYEPKIQGGDVIPDDFRSLEFKNVSFKYTDDGDYIIKNASFRIEKGQTIAVVGHNGAGKTTLSKLLMRFYDVTDGEILYNGINIKEYDLLLYRQKFASVFQDYKVFAMTVSENVLTEEITPENEKLAVDALKMAGVYDKIATFPNKENSLLTKEFDENGILLSGGETQKVTIARLFASDFDIAVLDEPSSALDPVAESRMYDALLKGTQGKTVIYISHRLSSATRSDNILVFNNGILTEQGTHAELMSRDGEYNHMFTLQASGYKEVVS
jgi:ATP-binding cassette subfamily B protein